MGTNTWLSGGSFGGPPTVQALAGSPPSSVSLWSLEWRVIKVSRALSTFS